MNYHWMMILRFSMIEVSALLLTLLAEATAVLSLILIIWIVLSVRKKSRDKAAATQLVQHIKKQADERMEKIRDFLKTVGHDEAELHINAKKIDRLEKDFFTRLIRLYIKRDATLLTNMDEQLDHLIEAYKTALPQQSGANSETDEKSQETIESLMAEKEALTLELKITKTTMGNMIKEFNTLFNGGSNTVQNSKEILQSTMAKVEDEAMVEEADLADEDDEIEINSDETVADGIDLSSAVTDDVLNELDASAPQTISEKNDDFGDIVSSEDVDDIFDSIDLSKEIDTK